MVMPDEYKHTDIGIIPKDWSVELLGNALGRLDAGVSVNSDMQIISKYYVLKTSAIHDGTVDCDEVKPVISRDYSRLKCPLKSGSIIISRMNTPALVGECGYVSTEGNDVFLPDRLWQAQNSDTSEFDFRWLNYLLNTESYRNAIRATATGTSNSMKNISKERLDEIVIPQPRKEEQCAIAEALFDMDKLISSLEKLIDKKKAIKQGAMQELLAGKIRLPGYYGEWTEKALGELLSIEHGQNQSAIESPYGDIPIFGTGGEIGKATKYLYDKESVLIGRKGTIDRPRYINIPFWTIDTLFYTEIFENVSAKFMFYIFCTIDWMSYNEASGVPSLSSKIIENIRVSIPEYEEQIAIANVLSDMDKEINALNRKLNKYRQIKKGMMQQLLTGRKRLV